MLHIIDICLEVYTRNLIYSRTNFTNSVLQLQLLVGGLGGSPPPTNQKIGLSPPIFPYSFVPKMLIFQFSCSLWPFCPICPPPRVDLIYEPWFKNSTEKFNIYTHVKVEKYMKQPVKPVYLLKNVSLIYPKLVCPL